MPRNATGLLSPEERHEMCARRVFPSYRQVRDRDDCLPVWKPCSRRATKRRRRKHDGATIMLCTQHATHWDKYGFLP